MIESAVTIALVPQIQKGPWIFWYDLEKSMEKSAQLGFDAIELFTEDARPISPVRTQDYWIKAGWHQADAGDRAVTYVHRL